MVVSFARNGARRAVAVCLAVVAVNTAIALSDQAARLWNTTAGEINTSQEVVAEVVASTGVTRSQGDWAVHSVLWALSGFLAVLLIARIPHVVGVLASFAAAGCALELLQNVVTNERSAQWMDMVGNLIGLGCGAVIGALVRRAMRPGPGVVQLPRRGPST